MEDGLAEDSMVPGDGGSIVLGEELLYLALQCQQLGIQFGRHFTIAGIVTFGNDKDMAFNKWGMIGNGQKCRCFFQDVGCNITTLAKRTINIICFSIQGGAAPVLHADCSLFTSCENDDLSIAQARWTWQASGFSILQNFIP